MQRLLTHRLQPMIARLPLTPQTKHPDYWDIGKVFPAQYKHHTLQQSSSCQRASSHSCSVSKENYEARRIILHMQFYLGNASLLVLVAPQSL